MSRYYSYINSASEILSSYTGQEPLAVYLKKYFAARPKFGSKDRKQVADLCYCYFRPGHLEFTGGMEDRIISSYFLCHTKASALLAQVRPEWNEMISLPMMEKFRMLFPGEDIQRMFPWIDLVSEGIDKEQFAISHLNQPDLFLRIRPTKEVFVKTALDAAAISYYEPFTGCIGMANSVKADKVLTINRDVVVQDLNSQRTLDSLSGRLSPSAHVWDCCAASGGKSILLHDKFPDSYITVSDIRDSILHNLDSRFKDAGIRKYQRRVADLSKNPLPDLRERFDLIIADLPCTGSGTWARTPEQLYFFSQNKISEYAALQQNIIKNALPALKKGGLLLYITCSVFREENEDAVKTITEMHGLETIISESHYGYEKAADSLFTALLKKSM